MEHSIFTVMQSKIGCEFISDLPHDSKVVLGEMKSMKLSDYTEKELEDFSKYVFGVPYDVIKEALHRKEDYHGYKNVGKRKSSIKK